MKVDFINKCPFCCATVHVKVEREKLDIYKRGDKNIQDVFPDLSPSEREKIKTGLCDVCQDAIFGGNK